MKVLPPARGIPASIAGLLGLRLWLRVSSSGIPTGQEKPRGRSWASVSGLLPLVASSPQLIPDHRLAAMSVPAPLSIEHWSPLSLAVFDAQITLRACRVEPSPTVLTPPPATAW